MDEHEEEFCDCVCRCDEWDRAQTYGRVVLLVLTFLLLSFIWTDGWGLIDEC